MCITPFGVKNKVSGETISVPCGKCPTCKKRRASGWSFRLMQEYKQSTSAHFITLTYDTEKVNITPKGYMNLKKRDLQLFFKKLRKKHDKKTKIKYYAVGEYGSRTNRPHYHIILFNASLDLIQPAWDNGHVHYGSVNEASVGYTLKYISKNGRIPMHQNDDRQKEFSLMSKKLGANYMSKEMINWHKKDLENRFYCNLTDGKKISMPRYYKDKIYTEQERKVVKFFTQKRIVEKQIQEIEKDPYYFEKKLIKDQAKFKKMEFLNQKPDKI